MFNLTALISFDRDMITGSEKDKDVENSDVRWLIDRLERRAFPILHQEISGKHLEPIGIQIGDYVVDLNSFGKFIKPLKRRYLESLTVQFLEKLKQRAELNISKPTTSNISQLSKVG